MIQRCRGEYPVRLMCRCLEVSPSGFYAWLDRPMSQRAADNQRLRQRMWTHYEGPHGVLGTPRMYEELFYGERVSLNRVARLIAAEGLQGIPQRRAWRRKRSGSRPIVAP